MAKTVTGKEVHVLLSDDHVAIVPFDELLEQMKTDAQANVWRMKQQDDMERTIGPINGFRLRYCFVKEDVVGRSDAGTYMTGSVSRFSHCYVLPVTTPAGEPAPRGAAAQLGVLSTFAAAASPRARRLRSGPTRATYERLRELKRAIRAGRLSNRRPAAAQGNADRRLAPRQRFAQRIAGESIG